MTSEVTICNLALAHLGDRATVVSIDPPEGSPQAGHCAQFYAPTRDMVLEMHTWSFTKRRIALALVENPSSTWAYAYAMPNLCTGVLAILDPDAADDFSASASSQTDSFEVPTGVNQTQGAYTPQAFDIETLDDGSVVILTNQTDAVCRYTVAITDPAKFSALFVQALSRFLASALAGPVVKGEAGRKAALDQAKMGEYFLRMAKETDANSRNVKPTHQVPWLAARG